MHHFFQAKDIPGKNDYYTITYLDQIYEEEIFLTAGKPVLFHGQPVGIILADTFSLANRAATLVSITYELNPTKLVLPTIQHVIQHKATERHVACNQSFAMLGQYHFTMEPQTTICLPAEDGFDVLAAVQYIDFVQIALANCLNLPNNAFNMVFRRLGGAYGAKSTHSAQVACAAAIGSYLTNRPVRFVLSLESNMAIIGKRLGLVSEHTVEVDATGRIQRLVNSYIQDKGCSLNEDIATMSNVFFPSCYNSDSWSSTGQKALTDAPSHTFCRAPGSAEGIAMIENIMDNIVNRTGLDPVQVRLANIDAGHKMHRLLPGFVADVGKKITLFDRQRHAFTFFFIYIYRENVSTL